MKQRHRDLAFYGDFTKAHAVRRVFFCCIMLYCFGFMLFYRSNLVPYRLEDGYEKITEVFAGFGLVQERFWCNRSDESVDVCHLSGDVRVTTGDVRSVILYSRLNEATLSLTGAFVNCSEHQDERIRPYGRKFDDNAMSTVEELELKCEGVSTKGRSNFRKAFGASTETFCNQTHSAPALLFSSAGFSGNPYHDFRETIIPLYITAQHMKGEVVLLINDVRHFWVRRWMPFFRHLSHYPVVEMQEPSGDHCFREITTGLYTHNVEFGLASAMMPNGESIDDFVNLLGDALAAQGDPMPMLPADVITRTNLREGRVPKLLIMMRTDTRMFVNLEDVRNKALELGFDVQVASLSKDIDLRLVYRWFHSSDVVMCAHGSELAYMIFMRKKTVLIQVSPIGTDWPSRVYYGEPAERELGLHYFQYKIEGNESTLADKYGLEDRVLLDPSYIESQGFQAVYKVYLTEQNLRPSPEKLGEIFASAKALVSDLPVEP